MKKSMTKTVNGSRLLQVTGLKESKQEATKEVIKEVPQQKQEEPKKTNKAWYNCKSL